MAVSTCVRCASTTFELVPVTPNGSAVQMYFVQCASCGGVVGTVPIVHTAAALAQQNEALKEIAKKLGASVNL